MLLVKKAMTEIIRFHGIWDDNGEFSNYFNAPFLDSNGYRWETVEHYYQAQKFAHIPSYFHLIRFADNPQKACLLGSFDVSDSRLGNQTVYEGAKYSVNSEILRNAHHRMREDWDLVKLAIMYEALTFKFTQHPSLLRQLLNTGTAEIHYDDPLTAYWGVGFDGKGNNWLGHLLMTLRQTLNT